MTTCTNTAPVNPRPDDVASWWLNVADYTYMWWAKGLRDQDKIFNIQTSRYGLSFDADNMQLRKLGAIRTPLSESDVLTQDNSIIELLPDVTLEMALEKEGHRYELTGAGPLSQNFQLIESGKYFQRRWLTKLAFASGAPSIDLLHSGLEIAAWPDRVAFILHLVAKESIENSNLEMRLHVPAQYSSMVSKTDGVAITLEDGNGFTLVKHTSEASISLDEVTGVCTVRMDTGSIWTAGEERVVGMIVYPAVHADLELDTALISETDPVTIEAVQVLPEPAVLDVSYDRGLGWYYVHLHNDGDTSGYAESSNDRIEQVTITINNPDPHPRVVRLNFGKDGQVFGITGLSAIMRDSEHNPLGVPIQLSKNWHTSNVDESLRAPFEGPWYHGLTMLTIPPESRVTFEYVSVNALWGQVPAASHAQLCLVGWGSNQLWDEAAIGSWGESLCFEPDQAQAGTAVLDSRPLMVWAMREEPQQKWGWTNNVGGANFLVYYDEAVQKQWNSRMKTMYRRYCPNLTEVSYAGTSNDGKIDIQYTVSLYRSDDITRGVYRFRYDVNETVDFKRLVLFEVGGDDYSYTGERKFAYGNEDGLIKEWETEWGSGQYRTERMALTGNIPWISLHEAIPRNSNGAWANRGIIIRQWDAVLGGQPAKAWFAERGAYVRNEATSLAEILPPEDVAQLIPGDFVEAEVVHVIMPQYADDYYGPNTNLAHALQAGENTWKMVYREATGNALDINVRRGGTLLRAYPIQIRSTGGNIRFDVTGGLGYVPVTFTELTDFRGFQLEQKINGDWVKIDQSNYGSDFWQTDYNANTATWEITYSLNLDTPDDKRTRVEFRLTK